MLPGFGEAHKLRIEAVNVFAGKFVAQFFAFVGESSSARVLTEDDAVTRSTHRFRLHNLITDGIVQDAVLVHTRFMRKGIPSHDGFVGLRLKAEDLREQATGGIDLFMADARLKRIAVTADVERHDDLLQGSISRPLTDAVDGTFDLPRSGLNADERIGNRQAQVVVAMDRDGDVLHTLHALPNDSDQLRIFCRRGVANRVADVEGGCSCFHDGLQDFAQVGGVRARSVLGENSTSAQRDRA